MRSPSPTRAEQPPREDGQALAAVGAMFFANGAVYATWAARIPELRDQVGADVGTLGLILGVAGILGLAGSLVAGFTVDRFGSRANIIVAGMILCGALIVVGSSTTPLILGAALATLSLADTLTDVGMNVQGAQISARRRRPVVNRLHGVWSLGAMTGGVIATLAAGRGMSLDAHMALVAAVLLAIVASAGARLLAQDDRLVEAAPGGREQRRGFWPVLALLTTLGLLGTLVETIPSDWSALRLTDDLDAPPDVAGLALVAFTASMLAGRLAGDFIVERAGARRVMVVAPIICGLGLSMATLGPSVIVSLGGFAVAGLGASVLFPLIYARAATTPGINPGRGLAFMTAGQRSATLLGPVLVGFLAGRDAISVGQAVACLVLPASLALVVIGVRGARRRPAVS